MGTNRLRCSSLTNSILPTFIRRDASTCRLQTHEGTSEMEKALEETGVSAEKVAFKEKWVFAKKVSFEEKGVSTEKVRGSLTSDGNTRRWSRGFSEGYTPKGIRLRVANSHIGNHLEDDFTPLETFEGFPCAYPELVPRLLQRLNDTVKAATEVVGCYGGCHISSSSILLTFIARDALTYRLQTREGTSEMERAFEEKGVSTEKVAFEEKRVSQR
ncbi:hypothetical protein Tco_1033826, partial [Tanacetum coccineum]